MSTTAAAVDPHPLVLKKANEWVALAAKYGVKATILPMPDDSYYPTGLIVNFETRSHMERGSVSIYPPTRKGRTVRQSPLIMRHYRGVGGKIKYGQKPGTDLRDLRTHVMDYWSPTWSARLAAQTARIEAARAERAEATA